jgi:hypothetical protein
MKKLFRPFVLALVVILCSIGTVKAQMGIGTTSPSHPLSVYANSDPLRFLGLQHNITIDTFMVINPSGVVYKRSLSSFTSNLWKTTGNSGTSASTNFIGTTDSVDFVIRVNNNTVGKYIAGKRSFQGGKNTVVTGTNTYGFGLADTVASSYSLVGGNNNNLKSGSDYSLAVGGDNITKSTASYSVVSGELNIVEGVHSSGHGEHLFVNSYNMFAVGSYNDTVAGNRQWVDSTNHLFVVGNGHKFCDRSNVITATWGGNVGIDNANPQTAMDIHGALSLRPRTTLTQGTVDPVTSNDFNYTVENRSYLRIDSDNSPSQRAIVLSDGLQIGQIIVIECVAVGGFNGIRIVDNVGTHNTNTNGTYDLYENDIIVMIWNGDAWTEVSYTDN